ncbi:hypothetical protein CYLTODRAFT_423284 [Cylindrobasidium torrendii FP15055 ss-10]|uniref:Uncharacterized protein n=1 Tax=Cylindrobasidium torrendii FP15055 ss-10 TaxID=1314674 RepID=A0A0D7B7U8_9AGAR|nr:hypothetical protein CYLTODRAFT_423284 [Cylindrobasidium torrendii FP15055 ss-10]
MERRDICPVDGCPCPNHHLSTARIDENRVNPLTEYFTTNNDVPPDDEADGIKAILMHLREIKTAKDVQAEHLRREVARLDAALVALDAEREQLQESIRQGEYVYSAVRRLPLEVLQHIFQYTINFPPSRPSIHSRENRELSEDSDDEQWQSRSAILRSPPKHLHPLQTFRHVSLRWRAAVLDDPILWSSLTINIAVHANSGHISLNESRLNQHLVFSRTAPLRIAFTCDSIWDWESLQTHATHLVACLIPHAARIVELYLLLPSPVVQVFGALRERMTSLSSLLLRNTPWTGSEGDSSRDQPFDAYFLKRLVLQDFPFPLNCIAGRLSSTWVNLVHLELLATQNKRYFVGPSLDRILELLGLTSHLRTAVICVEFDFHFGEVPRRVTCPQLLQLTIRVERDSPLMVELMNSLTFPALEYLSFPSSTRSESWIRSKSFESVLTAIDRSCAPLKTFQCSVLHLTPRDIHRLVEVAPELESLVLQSIEQPDDVFALVQALTPDERGAPLPQLRVFGVDLDVDGHSGSTQDVVQGIIEMANRRCAAGALQVLMVQLVEPGPRAKIALESIRVGIEY